MDQLKRKEQSDIINQLANFDSKNVDEIVQKARKGKKKEEGFKKIKLVHVKVISGFDVKVEETADDLDDDIIDDEEFRAVDFEEVEGYFKITPGTVYSCPWTAPLLKDSELCKGMGFVPQFTFKRAFKSIEGIFDGVV
jgi:hypothetical protein